MLPEEIIAQLNAEFQCRDQLIQHLAALYSVRKCGIPSQHHTNNQPQAHLPSASFLNIHGLTATGKSSILRSYFHLSQVPHVIINVRECITARHLLERIVAASLDALDEFNDETIDRRPYARTENLSALCVNMSKLLEGRGKFVLVLDAMDRLREGGGTLISALARLGEMVCFRMHTPKYTMVNKASRYQTSRSYLLQPSLSHPLSYTPRPLPFSISHHTRVPNF